MFFKNKCLPLNSTKLSKEEAEYLINKIDSWLYILSKTYIHNFWHQNNSKWYSKEARLDRHVQSIIVERLDNILANVKRNSILHNEVVLSENDVKLINDTYEKIRFKIKVPFR